MEYTREKIEKGFEEWERRHREDPSQFLSSIEKAALTLEDYGKECADCLVEAMGVKRQYRKRSK